jgi:DNA-binding transcriptional LysR family regulator
MNERWRTVEVRHLLALRAVAEEQSFHGAAARLGYTQSAISQQISALERIVGEQLVARPGGRKPVALTDAGDVLLGHVDAVVARLAAADADLRSLRAGDRAGLRIGAYQSVGVKLMPELVRRFSVARPQVTIELVEATNDVVLTHGLERGETNLAFLDLPLLPGPFDAVEILRDPYVLVVQAQSPLAVSGRRPALAEVAALPILCFKSGRCADRFLPHLTIDGRPPNIVFRSDQNDTLQAMAAAGMGVAVMPRLAVDERDESVRVVDLAPALPPRVIALAWHRERVRREVDAAFVELVLATCVPGRRATGSMW